MFILLPQTVVHLASALNLYRASMKRVNTFCRLVSISYTTISAGRLERPFKDEYRFIEISESRSTPLNNVWRVFFLATFKIQHCDTCSQCLCFYFYFVKINVSNMQMRENLNYDVLSEIILYFISSYTGFSNLKSSVYI